jgi:hypothetical protein
MGQFNPSDRVFARLSKKPEDASGKGFPERTPE